MISPGDDQDRRRERVRDDVGERAAREHGRPRHRQRAEAVDQALVQVLVQAERGDEPAEGDVLDDDPRDQEVDVGEPGRPDRAAEHVAEQQHEHDRLHGEREQQLGARGSRIRLRSAIISVSVTSRLTPRPPPASSPAPRRRGRSAPGTRRRASGAGARGRRRRRRPRSARCTASTIAPPPLAHAERHQAVDGRRRLVGHRRERPHRGLGVGRVVEPDLEPLAADAVLELVGGALARSRGRGRSPRSCPPAGRPRRGTASSAARSSPPATSPSIISHSCSRLRGSRPGRRLVEEQHRRLGDERRRQVEPPAHAARVGLRRPVRRVDAGRSARAARCPAPSPTRAARAVQPAHHRQVLEPGQVLVDGRVLAGEPDPLAQPRRVAHDVEPDHARAFRRRASAAS